MIPLIHKIALSSQGKSTGLPTTLLSHVFRMKYRPLIIRKNTTDIKVFRQIFIWQDYNFLDILPNKNPRFIVDGGANAGYSSLWFANKFPNAKILAIEPEKKNFQVLQRNIVKKKNISAIEAGIWGDNSELAIQDPECGEWCFVTREAHSDDTKKIPSITIDKILRDSNFSKIDILKLDIEGAEENVFSSNYKDWLNRVDVIILELHDRYVVGSSKAVYSTMCNYKFKKHTRRENIIFVKQNSSAANVQQ